MTDKERLFPPFPEALMRHFERAEALYCERTLVALDFSRRTYQVRVKEGGEEFWCLLHLNEEDELSESFCLCSETRGEEGCPHVLAALFFIFDGGLIPLHKRYEESLFAALFQKLFEESPLLFPSLKKKIGLKGNTAEGKKFIADLSEKIVLQSDEESLQYSDLTENELEQIETKRLSAALRFHFSPHNELAKALFARGYLGDKIECVSCEKGLFQSRALSFKIPSTADFPAFFEKKAKIERVEFNPKDRTLTLDYGKKQETFSENEIAPALCSHAQEINPIFQIGSKKPVFLSKNGSFSKNGDLNIDPYVNAQGDLNDALYFGRWIYKKNKFLFNSGPAFLPIIVPQDEVEAYILAHQAELEGMPGFRLHKKQIMERAHFFLDQEGNLHLERRREGYVDGARYFGRLLYMPDEGFFSIAEEEGWHEGVIPKRKVGSFLRRHDRALSMIPAFFMDSSPLERFSLKIEVSSNNKLEVIPKPHLKKEFENQRCHLYEGWIYTEGHGFFPISPNEIPYDLIEKKEYDSSDFEELFDESWSKITSFMEEIPLSLRLIADPQIVLKELYWSEPEKKWHFYIEYGGAPLNTLWKTGALFFLGQNGRLDLRNPTFLALKKTLSSPDKGAPLELLRFLYSFEVEVDEACRSLVKPLLKLEATVPLDLQFLKSNLRDYQKKAVEWLWFLYTQRLSALLADDMGLGKTHEAMGLIAALFKNPQEEGKPSCLIVCPTSLLFHWEEKLATFLPEVKVHLFWGKDRSLMEAPLILTSYTVFRRDFALFEEKSYSLAIFDEVQLAKNHQSRLSEVLKRVAARMKLGLSGTPIENRLREIKALFDLLLPGLMPSEREFYEEYVLPIEKEGDRQAEKALQKKISPFILRRTKEEVLTELPEKIEGVEKTCMEEAQEILYHQILEKGKRSVLQPLLQGEKPTSLIPIFALITELKKVCNHPALYYKDVEGYKQYPCGKWDLFKELVDEALNSGQKVVVFSHFLQMLDIIERYLEEEKIEFSRLRGETKNRKEAVDRFQKDPNCRLFVASLQAGGLGIDLTAASVVIHYDRWWNFAKENQATDRVHRLGQTRGVQVFKLMTKGTIEEHIDRLIQKKADLHEKMVSRDEADLLKSFSASDLRALFGFDI